MKTPNFNTSTKEFRIIVRIVKRAEKLARKFLGQPTDRTSLWMDIAATHNTCPLKLEELLAADDANFSHDIFNIVRHMDRKTGELGGCFLPRFAREQGE